MATVSAPSVGADLPVTWGHVSLGSPAAALRERLGDPLRILSFDDSARNVARYWIPGADSTFLLVIDERGYIVGFQIFSADAPASVVTTVPPDPSGVRLGDTLETVKAKHPDFTQTTSDGQPVLTGKTSPAVAAVYSFTANRVESIQWGIRLNPELPDLPRITLPSGDSPANAIADVQQNETDGVAWEYRYLFFHPCSGEARWKLKAQALLHENGRSYDRLTVVCPANNAQRDYYFDITSYFGKS